MQFRPCIDIHNGAVKQIVGSTLIDEGDRASENFVSGQDAPFYAKMYKEMGFSGGHVIMLNAKDSPYYEKTRQQAMAALSAYPGMLQAGGGITPVNAESFLEAGASHVIVTSYVFSDGKVHEDRLTRLKQAVGKERLVLDLSCRKQGDDYYICTDRWQKMTDLRLTPETLDSFAGCCDEFLIHAVDVEGKGRGIETGVASLLGSWCGDNPDFSEKVTYAGGVGNFEDLEKLKNLGKGHINVTIGSALSIFGGTMDIKAVRKFILRGHIQ